MNRVILPLVVVVVLGAGLWFGLTNRTAAAPRDVAMLLPPETLAFAHVPDVNRSLTSWRETDIYRLWQEPAVQDFLQKPLTREQNVAVAQQQIEQLQRIEMRDVFAAIVPDGGGAPKIVGGFRFSGPQRTVEEVIAPWKARITDRPDTKRETVQHQRHRIEVFTRGDELRLALVFSGEWCYAGNDVAALQALLDRADGRAPATAPSLLADADYVAHLGHMPQQYAAFAFARLDRFPAEWRSNLSPAGQNTAAFPQVRGVSGATRFDGGKMRDTMFVAMPRIAEGTELTRSSLALATSEAFLYAAGMLQLPDRLQQGAGGPLWAAGTADRLLSVVAETGITAEEWHHAFGVELGFIGDWPATSRFPGILLVLPVRDAAAANELMNRVTTAAQGNGWSRSEREGTRYYAQMPTNPMLPIAPTIAITDQLAILGLDTRAVEAAVARSKTREDGLANAQHFTFIASAVPEPRTSFTYIDLPLLYTRLDAAVRPMLIMAAAFVPDLAQKVDLGKLPPPEVVVRHLSPVVASQRYEDGGYLTDTISPISLYQIALPLFTHRRAAANRLLRNQQLQQPPGSPPAAPAPTPDEELEEQ
jgi:hypothetical protein